jgi:hypothetical protein
MRFLNVGAAADAVETVGVGIVGTPAAGALDYAASLAAYIIAEKGITDDYNLCLSKCNLVCP